MSNALRGSNQTLKFEFHFEDGEVVSDKCRDSVGGFANMMNRLRAHTGAANWGPMGVKMDLGGKAGTANGRRFVVVAL